MYDPAAPPAEATGPSMARRIRDFDWSATPLGPRDAWPPFLVALVDLMLATPQPAWIAWGDEMLCLYNDAHVPVLGTKHPGALGRPVPETWRELGDVVAPVLRATLDGASQFFADVPFTMAGRPGRPVGWFTYTHTPIRDERGVVRGVYSVGLETTGRVLAERARQEAESRFRTLFDEATPDAIFIHEDGRIVDVNRRACDSLGYTREELLSMSIFDVECEHDAAHADETFAAFEAGASRAFTGRHRRKDGSTFPVEARVGRLARDDDRRILVAIVRDVTEKLAVSAIRERAAAAESAARARSEFLANMSHEIRTPLSGVLGLAQLGRREAAGAPSLEARFEKILECGHLLRTVIDDVLDFSKIEAGKLDVETVEFDPAAIVATAVELFDAAAARKGLALVAELDATLPLRCLGDPTRLQQVLLNLVSNGVKFTAAGTVTVSAAARGSRLEFEVRDTGIGIAADALQRIFEPFEQGDGSITRRYGGTGLGLAISQRLAVLMGGALTVDSAVGAGSTFRLSMPLHLARPVKSTRADAADGAGARLDGLRVLAAEDDEFCALILRAALEEAGASVELVENGRDALQAVTRDPSAFDVVLTDVQMPGMDGVELTHRLRDVAPGLPVIGQTAHALREEVDRYLSAGMRTTVQKPYDLEEFVATVARYARPAGRG